jgi:hypothetical protein
MPNRLVGRVLCSETGTGVPHLIVAAVDVDIAATVPPTATHLPNAPANAPLDPGGRERLGSVLTDSDGWFELEFDDDLFVAGDAPKTRPDIELLVIAPDRPQSDTNPVGLPLQERLLYRSHLPTVDAGRIESFIVRLSDARLQALGISLAHEAAPRLSPIALREGLLARSARTRGFGAVRGEILAASAPMMIAERTESASLMVRLAGDSPFGRTGFAGLATPLPGLRDILFGHISDFLRPLSDQRFAIRVRLRDDDVAALGGTAAALASGGRLSTTLCDVCGRLGTEGSLVRNRNLLTEVMARRAVTSLSSSAAPVAPAPPDTPPAPPEDVRAALQRSIMDRLAAQVGQLPEQAAIEPGGAANELHRIKEVVRKLELAGGPANVVASHDVNVLQIAFESTWTSLFDQRFERDVRELYRNVVRLRDDYGVDAGDVEAVSNASDLRRLLNDLTSAADYAALDPVPSRIQRSFPWITQRVWARLDDEGREALMALAEEAGPAVVRPAGARTRRPATERSGRTGGDVVVVSPGHPDGTNDMRARVQEIVDAHSQSPIAAAERLVGDLERRLGEPYRFDVFVAGTINYGLLLTYRQEWSPVTYQVGRLVETMPLAPGETREFTVKRTTKDTRRNRRLDKSMREQSSESSTTSRIEAEAAETASQAINNRIGTEGSFNIGIGEIGVNSEFSQNFTQESRRLQKSFAEIARKAADKVRSELELTIESETETLRETNSKHTIANPNNEITVTYLLYELERRYQVASRLHRAQPVVLVALDMPRPDEISEGWLLEHAWILRSVLIDPSLARALDYLEEGRTGDSLDLELRRSTYLTQKRLAEELSREYSGLADQARSRRDEIVRYLRGEGEAAAGEADTGQRVAAAIFSGGLSELFGGGGSGSDEMLEARRKASEKALEYLEAQIETRGRALAEAQAALQESTRAFGDALKRKGERDTSIAQLQLHIRANVYHYMHQIWLRRHPDDRFFSLYNVEVPFFAPEPGAYALRAAAAGEIDEEVPGARRAGTPYILEYAPPRPPASAEAIPRRRLVEIADLDRPLGFRGNYAIFPLRGCSQLTDAMLHPYFDDYYGVRDPATGRRYTGHELLAYAREVWSDPDVALSEDDRRRLATLIVDAMLEFPDAVQEVVLPTGRLFMDALKGDQTLLEPFKLAHRGLDVMKVEEEIRARRVDTLRRAARISGEDLDVDPSDVDKYVIVKGAGATVPIES